MNKFIKITLIILVFAILTSPFLLKLKNIDEKIELTQLSFQYPTNFDDFKNLMTDYFYSTVKLTLSNYSDVAIPITQVKVNLYTLNNNLFLEQYAPEHDKIIIEPKSNTTLDLKYQIFYTDIVELIKDNQLNKKPMLLVKDLVLFQKLNTQIIAKGFVEVGGITINVNEKFNI